MTLPISRLPWVLCFRLYFFFRFFSALVSRTPTQCRMCLLHQHPSYHCIMYHTNLPIAPMCILQTSNFSHTLYPDPDASTPGHRRCSETVVRAGPETRMNACDVTRLDATRRSTGKVSLRHTDRPLRTSVYKPSWGALGDLRLAQTPPHFFSSSCSIPGQSASPVRPSQAETADLDGMRAQAPQDVGLRYVRWSWFLCVHGGWPQDIIGGACMHICALSKRDVAVQPYPRDDGWSATCGTRERVLKHAYMRI